jgi:saccharopine dehydrogenase (NAD+, L-lysine-forming)
MKPVAPISLPFPGFGTADVYTMGHPEAVTLPLTVPGLRRSINLQSGPDWFFDHIRAVAAEYEAGDVTLAEGAKKLESPVRPKERGPRDPLPDTWGLAYGERDGEAVRVAVYAKERPAGRMGGATGVPVAIGLELLRRGRVNGPGVMAPEAAIDAMEFFEAYKDLCDPPQQSVEDILVIDEASAER